MAASPALVDGATATHRPAHAERCPGCVDLRAHVARLLDVIVAAGIRPPDLERGEAATIPEGLTVRQVEVGILIARGYSNAQIADELYLGVNSVKTHVRGLFRALGVHNRTEAALLFVRLGLDASSGTNVLSVP